MTSYTAKVAREGRMWVVEVEGVGVTQARSLHEAQTMAADLIEVMTDVTVGPDQVQLEVDLPNGLTGHVRSARTATSAAEDAQREAAALLREATTRLRTDAGLTGRDAAFMLGVSEQRVSQLAAKRDLATGATRVAAGGAKGSKVKSRAASVAGKTVGKRTGTSSKSAAATALSQRRKKQA